MATLFQGSAKGSGRSAAIALASLAFVSAGSCTDSSSDDGGGSLKEDCEPIPAGCWIGVYNNGYGDCEWAWGDPVDCAVALISCGSQTNAGEFPGAEETYRRAEITCWNFCSPGKDDVYPDGGTFEPTPLGPGQYQGCVPACVDGMFVDHTLLSVFPCSVCASITKHTVKADNTCMEPEPDETILPVDAGVQ